jgi:hypothetical protein
MILSRLLPCSPIYGLARRRLTQDDIEQGLGAGLV